MKSYFQDSFGKKPISLDIGHKSMSSRLCLKVDVPIYQSGEAIRLNNSWD